MPSCTAGVDGTAVPLTAHGHFVVMTGAQIPALCNSARKGTNMRHSTTLRAALLLSVIAVAPARADVSLLAIGTLDGTTDLSGLTNTLENGVPANILGGLGSGIAFAGGDTFLAVPDRGPNAVPFDSNIDNTASYINRFQTLKLNLTANPGGAPSLHPYANAYKDHPALQRDAAHLRNWRRPRRRPRGARPEHPGQILFHRPVRQLRARRVFCDHERALRP